jgi:N-acetylmuramoyl-L-alanine amidase
VELEDRVEAARARRADLFVSLHFNAAADSGSDAKGVEVYCVTPAGAPSTNARGQGGGGPTMGNAFNHRSINLAWQIQKRLTGLGLEDRGVRRARFEVLRDAFMPAVLIEGGFLSNPEERKKVLDAAFRKKMAAAIADGIAAYKTKVEAAAPTPSPAPAR